jgi:hypothetical protein
MVLSHVDLSVLPELVVVIALDDVTTDARNLLHAIIVGEGGPRRNPGATMSLRHSSLARKAEVRC